MVAVLARYAARFSVRALDLTVDASLLWVGVGLAVAAAVLLAFVPRLPSAEASNGLGLSNGSVRITPAPTAGCALFAVTQIAASFVLLAGAGMLLTTLFALQRAQTGFNTRNVLAVNVPVVVLRRASREEIARFYKEAIRRIAELPGVERVAVGTIVPWRDAGVLRRRSSRSRATPRPTAKRIRARGSARCRRDSSPRSACRSSPAATSTTPTGATPRRSSSSARAWRSGCSRARTRVNRRLMWTDPVMKFIDVSTEPRRIVGVVADVDDENVVPGPAMTVYHPFEQEIGGGRLFVHARTDPYALVPPITRIIRELSAEQPVERAATLEDVRAEVLAPNRLNALVFGGFAGVALTIAVVGVAGVLAFSVSARTREFGVRLAIGSAPRHLLTRVLGEGAVIAGAGIVAGVVGGLLLARVVGSYIPDVQLPGPLPIAGRRGDSGGGGDPRVADAGGARLARGRRCRRCDRNSG